MYIYTSIYIYRYVYRYVYMYMYTFPPLTTFVRHDCYQHNAQVVHVFKSLAGWPKQQVSGSGRCSTGWGLAQRVGICPRKNRGPTCINHGSFEGSFVQLFSEQRKQILDRYSGQASCSKLRLMISIGTSRRCSWPVQSQRRSCFHMFSWVKSLRIQMHDVSL